MKKMIFVIAALMALFFGELRAADVPAIITPVTTAAAIVNTFTADVPFGTMAASATTNCASIAGTLKDWKCLSPTDLKARWYFRIRHKDRPADINNVVGLIDSKVTINGNDYYYYYVPLENKGNVVRFSDEGAYIRNLKFPVFGFIFLDVLLDPEIEYIKFPMKAGDTWQSSSTGTVFLINLFKISRKTTAKFTFLGEADIILSGKKEHVFRITSDIDKGDGKVEHEEQWFGVNLGMIYQDTEAYTLELYKFVPGNDVISGKDASSSPVSETQSAKM
ncbi:MAG: hypothetical protein ABSA34_04300 [Candidatus Goldiibacteriota bacterium]|jgi:hypothetical protein